MSDDSGEMVAASVRLGLPHPPGYPLFDLIGKLFSFLPLGSVAFRFNLSSAIFMLFSLAMILDTCRNLKFSTLDPRRNPVLLIVMGILLISCRSIFAQSLTAKGCVYALTLLFVSTLAWLKTKDSSKIGIAFLPWLLWGLGMANHWQTQILWLPALLFGFYEIKNKKSLKSFFRFAAFSLIGLSLYLYLPLRTATGVQPCWGYPVNWKGFYWVVSRQLVKGSENWVQPVTFYLHSFQWIFRTLFNYWLPGFFCVVLLGFATLWRKDRALFNFFAWLFIPVFLAVGLLHEERNQYLVPIYLISLNGIMLQAGFAGVNWICGKFFKEKPRIWIFSAFLVAASAGWLVHIYGLEDKSRYTLADDFGCNVLKGLPKNALLIADGDHYVMSLWYLKYARGLRPDLTFEPSVFLYHGWGWDQITVQTPDLRQPIYSSPLLMDRLQAITAQTSRHPFFYSLGWDYLEPVLNQMPGHWVPAGLAYEWRKNIPGPREISNVVLTTAKGERFRGISDQPDFATQDPSTFQIYRYYALQYDLTAQYLDKLELAGPPQGAK